MEEIKQTPPQPTAKKEEIPDKAIRECETRAGFTVFKKTSKGESRWLGFANTLQEAENLYRNGKV